MHEPGVASHPDDHLDLCRPFLLSLPITGASVVVLSGSGSQSTLGATDATAARIDELQFELGEGPQWLTARSGEPVLISDAARTANTAWPMFGSALTELAVGALFTFPMKMGAVLVGVASLYRDTAGGLSRDEQETAISIASAIAGIAVERGLASATEDAPPESLASPALRREVHQATGMILVQLDTTATIAYSRLQAYAFANGRTVQSVAHDVVTRQLVFDQDMPDPATEQRRQE